MESHDIEKLKERKRMLLEKDKMLLKEFREKYPDEKAYPNIEYDPYYASKSEALFEMIQELTSKIEELEKEEQKKHNADVDAERKLINSIQKLFPNVDISPYIKAFNKDGNGITYYRKSEAQLLSDIQSLQEQLNSLDIGVEQRSELNQKIITIYNKFIRDSKTSNNTKSLSDLSTMSDSDIDEFIEEMEMTNKNNEEKEEDMGMSM